MTAYANTISQSVTLQNALYKIKVVVSNIEANISICKAWLFYNHYSSFKKDKQLYIPFNPGLYRFATNSKKKMN